MHVLVTGATGLLGSHLVEQLAADGHRVRALVRSTSDTRHLQSLGLELAVASLESGEGLGEAVRDVDAVVHAAAAVRARSPEAFHEVNVGGTVRLLDAVRGRKPGIRRFVYVSSLAAHGFADDGRPRAADDPPKPLTHYGRSKLAGERVALAAQGEMPVSILRPAAIYGPRDKEMLAFFKLVARGVIPFLGKRTNRLSLVYAADCARAIRDVLVTDHPSGRAYFVDDGRAYTHEELGAAIARAVGGWKVRFNVPLSVLKVAAAASELHGHLRREAVMLTRDKLAELRHPYLVCSSADLRREIGWAPEVELDRGVALAAGWYREAGWI